MKRFATLAALCGTAALTLAIHSAAANDLGTYGETFDIAETDLLAYFGAKLQAAVKGGRVEALNRQFAATAQKHIEEPAPVSGLQTTETARTWLFDPSITAPEDLRDANGTVFVHAGDRINPLDRLPTYDRVMVFLDGRDPRQVWLALDRSKRLGAQRVVLILTAGAPVKLMKSSRTGFYYDQQGLLTGKFGITHVPAIVERAGNRLKVSEVLP